jgi:hypothetical protein
MMLVPILISSYLFHLVDRVFLLMTRPFIQTQSSVVLWDRIITRKRTEAARLRIEGLKAKNVWKVKRGGFKSVNCLVVCAAHTNHQHFLNRNIPSCQLSLKYDVMPYVGIVTPGIGARARNPMWRNVSSVASKSSLGEWDVAVPTVKVGGVGS